jgi:hypothetical protein
MNDNKPRNEHTCTKSNKTEWLSGAIWRVHPEFPKLAESPIATTTKITVGDVVVQYV